jgi:hypothetical protein
VYYSIRTDPDLGLGFAAFVMSHVDAMHVRSSWQGRGCRVLICTSSKDMPQLGSVCCDRVMRG